MVAALTKFYQSYKKSILMTLLMVISLPAIFIVIALYFPKATFIIDFLDRLAAPFVYKSSDAMSALSNATLVFFVYIAVFFLVSSWILLTLYKSKNYLILPFSIVLLVIAGIQLQARIAANEQKQVITEAKKIIGEFSIEVADAKFTTDENNKSLLSYTINLKNLPAVEKSYYLELGFLKDPQTITAFAPTIEFKLKDSKIESAKFENDVAMNLGLSTISLKDNSLLVVNDITGLDQSRILGIYAGLKEVDSYYYLIEQSFEL